MVINIWLFWSAVFFIAYIFLGYPLALSLWSAFRPKPWKKGAVQLPISIVIAAHNEAGHIGDKIRNLLSLDYDSDAVEILVGSDGSTDATAEEARAARGPRVRVFAFPHRRGKPAVLNSLVPQANGEIIVFADTRQSFDLHALRALIAPFADPDVGAVTGELMLADGAKGGAYWSYEKYVRYRESLVGSTVVVTGAIYAVRKPLFEPVPTDTVVDDLWIPMRVAQRGKRVIFEREAIAYETAAASRHEFHRKVRTLSGAFQLFSREPWLLNPMRNRLWFQTVSHKALRLIIAPLQAVALMTNIALSTSSAFYQVILAAQVLFYAGAIAGCVLPNRWKRPAAVNLAYTFCVLSWATVIGFIRCITDQQTVTWQKAIQ